MAFISWYTNMLIQKPFITKSVTSFITFGLGDIICQFLEKKSNPLKQFDYIRAIRQGSFGVIMTPYLHLQYNILMPKFFPLGNSYTNLIKLLVYDQTINASVFIFVFFTYIDLLSGLNLKTSLNNTMCKFKSTLIANWKVWPLVTIINFTLIPPPYRVFLANIVGLFWNVYLSYIQNVKGHMLINDKENKENKLV